MGAAAALALSASACGSGHASPRTTAPTAATAAPTTTTATPPPAPVHLRIVSPRRGAHVKSTLTVRVSLTGSGPHAALKYVLDGRFTHLGSSRVTFRDLAPGQHHLVVFLASRPSVRAKVSFTVPAPPPPPTPTTSAAPPPTTSAAPPPPTTQAPPPNSIPQGANAGDGDADNHGGPTDGDGNV